MANETPLRIGVTGGRDYDGWNAVIHALIQMPADAVLVHGACTGADSLCVDWWGNIRGRRCEPHPADWEKHGKAAGPLRNQEMVDSGLDLLIAFPGGRGTADMVQRATKAGVRIIHAVPQRLSGGAQ